jgi:nucleotide-binding universal stress UspA family protein
MPNDLISNEYSNPAGPLGLNVRNVLCWVSSFESPDGIVEVGKAYAATCRGICHVVMCLESPPVFHGKGLGVKGPLTPEVIGNAENRLASLYGNDVRTMVLPGNPIAEIRRYARTRQMDLIIMGEQGLALEAAHGERLYENAPCTVMVLVFPHSNGQPHMLGLGHLPGRTSTRGK